MTTDNQWPVVVMILECGILFLAYVWILKK